MCEGAIGFGRNFKEKSDLEMLRDAAELVRKNSPEGSVLLTQDTYLAVEANRSVPHGMEMGAFCYYPEMPREQAEALHLLNRDIDAGNTGRNQEAPVAAFSGYGLTIEMPGINEVLPEEALIFSKALFKRYDPLAHIPYFGPRPYFP